MKTDSIQRNLNAPPFTQKPPSSSLISRIMTSVLKILASIPAFFSRYCGSKINAGYKFEFDKSLTRAEALPFLPYVSAAAYSFAGKPEEFLLPLGLTPLLPSELNFQDPEIVPGQYAYYDKKTGLKISFAERGDEVLIAIPGLLSSAGNDKNELSKNYTHGLMRDPAKGINIAGGVPYVYVQAERVIGKILELERLKGKRVTLVGQCFGGSIAAYVALRKELKAICLNSLQLGTGLQAAIGDERLKKADLYVEHLMVQNDWLTDSKVIAGIDRALTFFHIRTPGNFGKKYLIPSAYSSCFKSHGFVLGSLMAHLGHNKRTTPRGLQGS